jgi:hypothetical protein
MFQLLDIDHAARGWSLWSVDEWLLESFDAARQQDGVFRCDPIGEIAALATRAGAKFVLPNPAVVRSTPFE